MPLAVALVPLFIDVFRAVAVAFFAPPGGAEIHPVSEHADVRRIVIEREFVRQPVILPVREVVGDPDAECHGRENVVPPLKKDHGGVCGFPADPDLAAVPLVLVELIAVVDV